MRFWLLLSVLLVLLSTTSLAVPIPRTEYGMVPVREYSPAQDQCRLSYYNFCSGWVLCSTGYCGNPFHEAPAPPMYGACFDLSECPGDCRHLDGVWWALKRFNSRGWADVEIYCADANGCPVGPPLAGIYDIHITLEAGAWRYFDFGGLPLCSCEESGAGKYAVIIRDIDTYGQCGWGYSWVPYLDNNNLNISAGCETDWRCGGTHSFVYNNAVAYCEVYGQPAPWWVSGPGYGCTNYPLIPPGCHNYQYDTGFYTEFLIDCYISCQGATETEEDSWGEVKRLYR